MSTYGVVSTINPPLLEKITQPNLIKFETEYAAYKEKVADVNRTRSEDEQLLPASIRQCIKAEVLHALCILKEIDGATTLEQATDEKVQQWFQAQLVAEPKDIAERIRSAIDSVSYEQCKADPSGAAKSFVIDIIRALDEHHASDVVQDSEKCKSLINKLIQKLEPEELRIRVNDQRVYWSSAEKSDIQFFMKRVCTLAVEVHHGEVARAKIKRKNTAGSSSRPNKGKSTKDLKDSDQPRKKFKKGPSNSSGKSSDQKPQKQRKQWDKACLNPDCTGIHRVVDCPNTSEEKKKDLLEKYWNERKSAKAVRHIEPDGWSEQEPRASDGRYRILLEEAVDSVALGDSGSDFNAITTNLLKEIQSTNSSIKAKPLEPPLSLKTAISGTDRAPIDFTASQSVAVSITIIMPSSHLPVRIRGVEFIVVDQPMDEVLLGRPFLKAIGFDLESHLECVKGAVHDKHIKDLVSTVDRGVPRQTDHPRDHESKGNRTSKRVGAADSTMCNPGNPDTTGGRLAKAIYQGLTYRGVDDDPIQLPESLSAGFGTDSSESIDKALTVITAKARDNGISPKGEQRLKALLQEHKDIFRIRLGSDPPAKVPPLVVKPVPNARPYRSPQRRYAPPQRAFIAHTVQELAKIGAIYKNPSSRWASPALAVPKPGTSTLRFTVDLRGPNAKSLPMQSAMPHLESQVQECQGSTFFAKIDFCHGYWQFTLAKESQEMFSIQTPLGVYTPTRLLQGGSDSGNHFQAVTQEKFAGRVPKLLQWLDDFLIHAGTESEILDYISQFFQVCTETGFKLHAEKTELFLREAKFCGRIITADGVRHDPRKLDALMNMRTPSTGSELQQLLCATNWMRTSIPSYAQITAPLQELMETAYAAVGSRTKRSVRNYSLSRSWGTIHDQSFDVIKEQLAASVKLAHPKSDHTMCLFTDASDSHWAAILTQVPQVDRRKPIEDQTHEPLCFLSGSFKGSSYNWSVPEKEGFAIVEAMCRLDYLICGHVVSIFTDHANLVYIYDPYGKNPGISRHTASKLMRWAIKLGEFRYVIEHMPGDKNVWADMLTRWAVKPSAAVCTAKVGLIKALMLAPINPGGDERLDWPRIEDVITAQRASSESYPSRFIPSAEGLKDDNGVLWIPSSGDLESPESDRSHRRNRMTRSRKRSVPGDKAITPEAIHILKLRILIAAHTGIAGHRGWRTTLSTVSSHFWWKGISDDVKSFVQSCLHCLATTPGNIVPRPMGHALHADEPNKLLHFDFCYMMPGENDMKYVLVFKDDLSGYVWLTPCSDTTADTVAQELLRWFSNFGIVEQWVSDRGSHFRNELIRQLREVLRTSHHFTLAYCPWSNGTVEVVNRELLRATRALLSEFQLPAIAWPSIMPMVQSALNNSPVTRLGGRCPLTVFTGLPQDTPLLTVKRTFDDVTKVHSLDEARARQALAAESIHATLHLMHKDVAERSDAKRSAAVQAHNRKTGVNSANFDVGDYVLRGVLQRERGSKPSLRWKGPYRVTECKSDYIFQVENILSSKREDVHGRRLKLFRNSLYEVSEDLRDHLAYQENELLVVQDFVDIRRNDGEVELLVHWRGFDECESDWVSLESLREDVPEMQQEYIDAVRESGTPRQRQIASSI